MSITDFELDAIKTLPFWAQALIAARMARRAVYWLPSNVPAATRELLVAACDAMERCIWSGARARKDLAVIEKATNLQNASLVGSAASAVYYAADAIHAAVGTESFGAADSACISSTQQAIAHAAQSSGMTRLQVHIFAASDFDVIGFACKEAGIGRYDPLTGEVSSRINPVNPPDQPTPPKTTPRGVNNTDDPTHGAR